MLYAVYSLQAGGAENGCRERISPYRAAEPRVTAVHVIALSAELRNSAGPGRAGSAAVPFSAGARLRTVQDIPVYDLFFPSKRNLFSYEWFCILSVRIYYRASRHTVKNGDLFATKFRAATGKTDVVLPALSRLKLHRVWPGSSRLFFPASRFLPYVLLRWLICPYG